MSGWYVTLAASGGLVGVFVAGVLVALGQAFPGGSAGKLNEGELAGMGIGIVAAGMALGAMTAGLAQVITRLWGLSMRSQPGGGSEVAMNLPDPEDTLNTHNNGGANHCRNGS